MPRRGARTASASLFFSMASIRRHITILSTVGLATRIRVSLPGPAGLPPPQDSLACPAGRWTSCAVEECKRKREREEGEL
jgi:hypothetical protein